MFEINNREIKINSLKEKSRKMEEDRRKLIEGNYYEKPKKSLKKSRKQKREDAKNLKLYNQTRGLDELDLTR